MLIASWLAGSEVSLPREAPDDVQATSECLAALSDLTRDPTLDARESGSTLRLLIPLSLAKRGGAVFKASGKLPQRPLSPLLEDLARHGLDGCSFTFPLWIHGALEPGRHKLPGNVSSQFVSGLLFALPLLNG